MYCCLDLNEDQIKAFRLADNKVSEQAEWDLSLLDIELDDINLDMEQFGFVLPEFEGIEIKQNERTRTGDAYNLDKYDQSMTEGYFQMPVIKPCNTVPNDLIGFNYMLTSENKNCGIHFYVDDYQFERIWNNPEDYIDKLLEYECMLTPDFSLYQEMPIAMKIWNTYRSRMIGQICQKHGLEVIPTVGWCEEQTFDFCFDGLPHNATLSISTIGVKKDSEAFEIWKHGVDEMIKRLSPKRLLIYGGMVEYDYGSIETIYYENHIIEKWRNNEGS